MDLTYLVIILLLTLTMTYVAKNTFFSRTIINSDMKDTIKKLTEQCLKENGMDEEWVFGSINELKYFKDNKEIKVQVFIVKVGENKTWNIIEHLTEITAEVLDKDTFKIIDFKQFNVNDPRKLYPSSTLTVDNYDFSLGIGDGIRELLGIYDKTKINTSDDPYDERYEMEEYKQYVNPNPNPEFRTNEPYRPPEHELQPEYGNQNVTEYLPMDEKTETTECLFMTPYTIKDEETNDILSFSCRVRHDYEINENVATTENYENIEDVDFF